MPPRNQPKPDVSLLAPPRRRYATRHPQPDDILLVVEVADTTLRYDTNVKLPIYARQAIRETWIVDVDAGRIHIHREPRDGKYRIVTTVERGGTASPSAFPELVVHVDDIVP
jgi:Uma2 family endonuclease